jgi:N-acetylglucosamine kinase-like BadF-type ATPase
MMEAMGCAAPLELIPRVYMLPIPRPEIAALNRIVMEHTEDPVARRILVQAAEDLACLVVNAVNRRGFAQGRYALALSGGNLGPHSPLIPAFLERLREWNREPMLHHHVQNPVIGALVMAAKNPVVGSSVL